MTQSKSTPVQGLIEWPLAAVVSKLRTISRTLVGENETALTEAANRLTRLEAEVGRLREALSEGVESAWCDMVLGCIHSNPARASSFRDDFYDWQKRARAALTPQTEAQSHAALNHQTGEG